MKNIILTVIVILITNTARGDEVFISSSLKSVEYVIYLTSLTIADKNNFNTIIPIGKNNVQLSERFYAIYNSTQTPRIFSDYGGTFTPDSSTTRIIVTIPMVSKTMVSALESSGKIKKIREQWIWLYKDGKREIRKVHWSNYMYYPDDESNKDWYIYKSTATKIK